MGGDEDGEVFVGMGGDWECVSVSLECVGSYVARKTAGRGIRARA